MIVIVLLDILYECFLNKYSNILLNDIDNHIYLLKFKELTNEKLDKIFNELYNNFINYLKTYNQIEIQSVIQYIIKLLKSN